MNITPKLGKRLGRIKDETDERDVIVRHAPMWASVRRDIYQYQSSAPLPSTVDVFHGLSLPVYDQGELGCHDEKTEVLTFEGWKRWSEYNGSEAVATVNPITKAIEFEFPIALHRYEYNGPMFYCPHRSLNFCVTPNHRMYSRPGVSCRRSIGDYRFRIASDLWYESEFLTTGTTFRGEKISSIKVGNRSYDGEDFVSLVALICSDGWVGGTDTNRDRYGFCCFRGERLEFVKPFAERLEFRYSREGCWYAEDSDMADWLRSNLYVGDSYHSPFKKIPDIIKNSSPQQIITFLKFFGDQSDSGKNEEFYSTSPTQIGDLQEMALRCGMFGAIHKKAARVTVLENGKEIIGRYPCYTLVIRKRGTLALREALQSETYKGEVFCASVPNCTLITRREGTVLVSGNSCTSNAGVLYRRFLAQRFSKYSAPDEDLSRLFLYYQERLLEGTTGEDAGAQIRDTFKTLAKVGVCTEQCDPYNPPTFANPLANDSSADLESAAIYRIGAYHRIPDVNTARSVLASGYAIELGFAVYESFESIGADGVMPMPKVPGEALLGGHAVLIRGYDDHREAFYVQNSWGEGWGDHGCFWMPYAFLNDTKLSQLDMWMGHLGKPWK